MLIEPREMMVGFDLGREYSRIACKSGEAERRTPEGLFSSVEQQEERAEEMLRAHFEECLSGFPEAGNMDKLRIMVTMHEMKAVWVYAIRSALEGMGIKPSGIFFQGHLDGFYYYMMHQKREMTLHRVALLEYERDCISAWEMWIERNERPAAARIKPGFRLFLDAKARAGRDGASWDSLRDDLLLERLQKMMEGSLFSSVYLVGDGFNMKWMDRSIKYMGRRRSVFFGNNLYALGAFFGAMREAGAEKSPGISYVGADMVEHNVGMRMSVNGEQKYYPLVKGGRNWYMIFYVCEFLMSGTDRLVLTSTDAKGAETEHTIVLDGLPARPRGATRIRLAVCFRGKKRCLVRAEDLGLGSFYPSSGKSWEAELRFV